VLGHLPDRPQPSQKRFETLVWDRIRSLDPARPVWVESESRKIGQCQVPEQLILRMRDAPCVRVDADDAVRARLLLSEYRHFVEDPERLAQRMTALTPLHGHERIDGWMKLAGAGPWEEFVVALLREHYDPSYDRSMRRNFARLDSAASVTLAGEDPASVDAAARRLIEAAA
jgi:tRNA 2-selenouridine synthase